MSGRIQSARPLRRHPLLASQYLSTESLRDDSRSSSVSVSKRTSNKVNPKRRHARACHHLRKLRKWLPHTPPPCNPTHSHPPTNTTPPGKPPTPPANTTATTVETTTTTVETTTTPVAASAPAVASCQSCVS